MTPILQTIINSRWTAPLLAVFMVLTVSSLKVYMYVDGVLKAYVQSFYVDSSDHYVYWTFHTKEIQELVDSLDGKRRDMDKRQSDLEALQTRLDNEKKELLDERAKLEALENGIGNTIVQSKESEMQNLKSLASTYSAMNPDAVVSVMNEMDDNTVVKILALMKSDTVGSIFEAMEKVPNQGPVMSERISRLTEKLRLYKQSPK
jgi:hypothetical protein